ncbi:sensor histidine kinase [Mongoliitalea daihaiensis]|uniref:sensor histidine kinase n=1 Tax=Mongoliitalea daihaiensis TaxID=2782006 RepID=UPI001F357C05|nr:histidine kinase [Mongoliitalea daihaiensis]UJP63915.1 histidine kinase [Mongoliitalea daihaiensis]
MKNNELHFKQIEWWIVTVLFTIIILTNVLNFGNYNFNNHHFSARYFSNIVIPALLYFSFFIFHTKLLPQYLETRSGGHFYFYSILLLVFGWIVSSILGFMTNWYSNPFNPQYFGPLALYAAYLVFVYLFNQSLKPPRLQDFTIYNLIRLVTIYIFIALFLVQGGKFIWDGISMFFVVFVPGLTALVLYNYFFIYLNRKNRNSQLAWRMYYLLIGLIVLTTAIFALTARHDGLSIGISGLVVLFVILVIVLPLSNFFFNKFDGYVHQINTLSVQVDQGIANLDFLKSQINPHFLFNALNTLYGTALLENSEKTAEGIQKLGDMMRFMLHENNQDKIQLDREKEYLMNYVDLQMLRLKDQSQVEVIFHKSEDAFTGLIAPMLLIPFIENAFKHGISMQQKSWVKISLRCLAGSVHLDVNNSIHRSNEQDPEKPNSGIGLSNVKQRLKLLYPKRHDLIIRENDMEYFVHLSIQLT